MDTNKFESLVAGAQSGDEKAWRQLHEMTNAYVLAIARFGFGLGSTGADDVSQEVWIKLYRSIDRIEKPERLLGWLKVTTRRQCISTVTSRWSTTELMDADALERAVVDQTDEPSELTALAEVQAIVRGGVDRAEGIGAAILQLQLEQPGISYEEIGHILGIPPGSIGPSRGRSIRRLAVNPDIMRLQAS